MIYLANRMKIVHIIPAYALLLQGRSKSSHLGSWLGCHSASSVRALAAR